MPFYGTSAAIAATILGKKGEILAAFTKKRHYTHSSCNRGKWGYFPMQTIISIDNQ